MATTQKKKKLGELLVDAGVLNAADLPRVLEEQRASGERMGETIVRLGLATEMTIAYALSDQLGFPCMDLGGAVVDRRALQLVPERLARKHLLLPITVVNQELQVAMTDPLRFDVLQDLRFATGCTVVPLLATASSLKEAIDRHYGATSESLDSLVKNMAGDRSIEFVADSVEQDARTDDLKRKSEAAPIVRMVNLIMSQAVENGASDIHIEPGKSSLVIRNRVDGILRQSLEAPKWVQGPVISRLKVMSRMDIAEKRLPQDGRVVVKVGPKAYDLRVSTIPTAHGEKVVIRVLDPSTVNVAIESMGMGRGELAVMRQAIARPQGVVIVTGPTGSGKTSTLYAMLNTLKSVERSITTIEDPVEYELAGINQTATQEKVGLTFASMLRALLRQDPDIIMVGEMRDADTASVAMQASITGHLVLSTMHTNNAAAAVTRLRNFGVPSYLIAASLNAVIAQRLVRKICPNCRTSAVPREEDLARLSQLVNVSNLTCHVGAGCPACNGSGYKGRTGVYEILPMSAELRALVASGADESAIRHRAAQSGMRSLLASGIDKVREGATTLAEVFRVIDIEDVEASDCPSCGEPVDDEYRVCPACSQHLGHACPGCDKPVMPSWHVCAYCAHALEPAAARPSGSLGHDSRDTGSASQYRGAANAA